VIPGDDNPLIGREVAQYRITGLIGRGGMGEVYLAEDRKLHRTVAMKRVRAEILESAPEARARLMREARIASKLVHPYIASVFDVVELDGDPLIVMEHLRGQPLSELIRERKLTPGEVKTLGIEIAEALSTIHGAGLVHRDLKPANVMITPDGHAKVMDFGLTGRNATSLDPGFDGNSPTITVTENIGPKGTPLYMAPEQIRGFRPDHRSDLFALGILLCEALTGTHPFRQATLADTLASILNNPPSGDDRVLSLTRGNTVGAIALKLLEKDPAQRYQLADEVVEQLKSAHTGALVSSTLVSGSSARVRTIGIAVVFVLALVAGLAWLQNSNPTRPTAPGRPAVAILSVEDLTERDSGRQSRGPMIAGLMTAQLGASSSVRAVSQERLRELPPTDGLSERLDRLGEALPVRWAVTGRVFDDDGTLVATFEVHDIESGDTESFSVSKLKATHLARQAAVVLLQTLGFEGEIAEPSAPADSDSEEAQALYTRARELLRTMDYAQALELAGRAVDIDPSFVEGRLLVVELYERLGYESRAVQEVRQTQERSRSRGEPEDTTTGLRLLARAAELTADRDGAERAYGLLVARFPDDPEYLSSLARIKNARSEHAEAAALYEDALLYDPLDPDLYLSRAASRVLAGEIADARLDVDEAKRLCELFRIRGCAGRVAETEGRLHWAERDLERSAESYGRSAEAFTAEGLTTRALLPLKSQADAELRLWRLDSGLDRLQRVVTPAREVGYDSLLVRTLNSLGAGLFRTRDLPGATPALREAVALSKQLDRPDWEHSAQVNLASVLVLSGDVQGAGSAVQRSLEIARDIDSSFREASSLLRQADVQSKLGDDDAARMTLNLVLETSLPGKSGSQLRRSAHQRMFWIEFDTDGVPAALEAAEAAVQESTTLGIEASIGYSLCLRAMAHSRMGQQDRAEEDLATAERHLAGFGHAPALADALRLGHAWLAAGNADWEGVLRQHPSGLPTTEGARLVLLHVRAQMESDRREDATALLRTLIDAPHTPSAVAVQARSLASTG